MREPHPGGGAEPPRLGHVHTRTWRCLRRRYLLVPTISAAPPLFPCAWAAHIPPVCRFCALAGRIALPSWSSARTLACWTEWTRNLGRIRSRILVCVAGLSAIEMCFCRLRGFPPLLLPLERAPAILPVRASSRLQSAVVRVQLSYLHPASLPIMCLRRSSSPSSPSSSNSVAALWPVPRSSPCLSPRRHVAPSHPRPRGCTPSLALLPLLRRSFWTVRTPCSFVRSLLYWRSP